MLSEGFERDGFPQVRPSFGSVLVPLFEEDGLRIGELTRRSRLTKQTMTTMVRAVEAIRFVRQEPDAEDRRATRVLLTAQARRFQPAAERILERIELMAARAEAGADLPAARRWLKSFAELGRSFH